MVIGLSSHEATERVHRYGYNEIKIEKKSPILVFLKKFTGLSSYVIEFSIVVALLLQKTIEAGVMIALLGINAILTTIQEGRAERAVALLQKKIVINAKTLRDGQWTTIPSRELVPGDVVKIMLGDIVPADLLIQDGSVMVDQSVLTGESLPVDKTSQAVVYAGSSIARGEAFGEVTATGTTTYYGKTAQLLQIGKSELVIERITFGLTKYLLILDVIFISVVVLQTIFFLAPSSISEILPLCLTLLIASIPVALPAMSTITLSLGALELAHQGVIVRNLDSVEDAAMMDVTCLDKTGTITENKLVISDVMVINPKYSKDDLISFAALASEQVTSDPIDTAINQYAKSTYPQGDTRFQLLHFKPFDPHVKKSEATVTIEGRSILIAKGAPQVIAASARNVNPVEFSALLNQLADRGSRALGVSIQEGEFIDLIGLIALEDHPRADSANLIAKLKMLGIRVKMITGDHAAVARTIARQVGLGEKVIRAQEMKDAQGKYLPAAIEDADVIAEVIPEDKFHAIEILQDQGHHVVGMTGDGVNDAPALHKADVGIAVSNATDVARSSAQIFLSHPGIQNIVDLVWSGRAIYRKVIIWVLNKIIKTFQVVFFVSLATILFNLTIITALQILLVLILFDFVTISISADKVAPSPVPEHWKLKKIAGTPSLLGALNVGESFIALFIASRFFGLSIIEIQTFTFFLLITSGLLNIFSIRERHHFWATRPRFLLLGIVICDITVGITIVTFGIFMSPLPLASTIFVLMYETACVLGINDYVKSQLMSKHHPRVKEYIGRTWKRVREFLHMRIAHTQPVIKGGQDVHHQGY